MSGQAAGLAAHACLACRKQKRKCDKELPECSLCRKNQRPCNYTPSATNPRDLTSSRGPQNSPARDEGASPSSLLSTPSVTQPVSIHAGLPALFFLDYDYFRFSSLSLGTAKPQLPAELIVYLEGQSQMRHAVDIYFNSVHTFFPIVSKLRCYQELANCQYSPTTEMALLLLAMQLHARPACDTAPPSHDIYILAKTCLSQVEAGHVLSVKLLQATLLVALYEISNAIYPAAYLTVGHCARLGHAMGLHDSKRAPQMLCIPRTSTEHEERCRVWWAVILLDRYTNLGGRHRPFACQDARTDEFLPIDDNNWDQGELAAVQPLAVSTATTVKVSPFARTCQATHLLSHVLRHLSDYDTDPEFRHQEAIQLHRTLQALLFTTLHEADERVKQMSDPTAHLSLCTATSLCFSSLLCLYGVYSCNATLKADELGSRYLREIQDIANLGLKELSRAALEFSGRLRAASELGGMLRTTPLVCDCLYQAAATFLWQSRETGNQDFLPMVTGIKDFLKILGSRWNCPKQYAEMIRNYEETIG